VAAAGLPAVWQQHATAPVALWLHRPSPTRSPMCCLTHTYACARRPQMMAQPPYDEKLAPFYLLHYTYGMDYTKEGVFTPGECRGACRVLVAESSGCTILARSSQILPIPPAHLAASLPCLLPPPTPTHPPTHTPPTHPSAPSAGKYGEWRFDKRSYAGLPPPRNLGEPPEGMKNELVRHLIHAINEATAKIPGGCGGWAGGWVGRGACCRGGQWMPCAGVGRCDAPKWSHEAGESAARMPPTAAAHCSPPPPPAAGWDDYQKTGVAKELWDGVV
jgi:hypothetical protein